MGILAPSSSLPDPPTQPPALVRILALRAASYRCTKAVPFAPLGGGNLKGGGIGLPP